MSENLVRDVHDAVATSSSTAEASVRPPGTSSRELRAMRRDVLRKLALERSSSVAEIGCGVGLLAVPVAERSAVYLGLDFAPQAVAVARERLARGGLGARAQVVCVDVVAGGEEEIRALGRFDRVLMYATFHYARDEEEALRFLRIVLELLAPGGRALIGNVPLDDLAVDWAPLAAASGRLSARLAAVRWMLARGRSAVPLRRRWKLGRVLATALGGRTRSEDFVPARLPPNYTVTLTTAGVERWLRRLGGGFVHRWELPAPGVPLVERRADLIIERR